MKSMFTQPIHGYQHDNCSIINWMIYYNTWFTWFSENSLFQNYTLYITHLSLLSFFHENAFRYRSEMYSVDKLPYPLSLVNDCIWKKRERRYKRVTCTKKKYRFFSFTSGNNLFYLFYFLFFLYYICPSPNA